MFYLGLAVTGLGVFQMVAANFAKTIKVEGDMSEYHARKFMFGSGLMFLLFGIGMLK